MRRLPFPAWLVAGLALSATPASGAQQQQSTPGATPQPRTDLKAVPSQANLDRANAASAAAPIPAPKDPEIVVSADRPRGSVVSDIPPDHVFKTLDVRAVGAVNIQDLLQNLGARAGLRTDDGDPIVLLNGKRVSSFAEIAKIPAEAIERMEVFPPELAIRYGYAPDRKVVNIVVLEQFNSRVGLVSVAGPSEGGRTTPSAGLNYLRIRGNSRLNVDADYSRSDSLLESDRDIVQPAGLAGQGAFRTLLPANERLVLNGTLSRELIKDVASTLNATFETNTSNSLFGLGANGPIAGRNQTRVAHVGTTWSGRLSRWQWTVTGNYDQSRVETTVDGAGLLADSTAAIATNSIVNADLLLSGPLLALPAGPISLSATGGVEFLAYDSQSVMGSAAQAANLSRDLGSLQVSVDLPLASRRRRAVASLGDLSVNLNVGVQALSDVGALKAHGAGLTWSPVPALTLTLSSRYEQVAPTVQQLGAPVIVTPNARLFDFVRQETVDVTRLVGGNPDLRPENRQSYNIGLTAKPFTKTDLVVTIDYRSARVANPLADFPILTPAVEMAFADRFTRGNDGRLRGINAAPINFARSKQSDIRVGLSFSRPLGAVPEALQSARVRVFQSDADIQWTLRPGNRLSRVEPGSAAARQVNNLTSRLYFGLTYTRRLTDDVFLSEFGPRLDLLDGGAIDIRGGRPRHEVEMQAGMFKRGLGGQLSANWQSSTRIDGINDQLRFADYGTLNLSAFVNLADRFGGPSAPDWLKGLRLNASVINVLNDRPRVRGNTGLTPVNYQGAYLNPLGRVIRLNLRKLF